MEHCDWIHEKGKHVTAVAVTVCVADADSAINFDFRIAPDSNGQRAEIPAQSCHCVLSQHPPRLSPPESTTPRTQILFHVAVCNHFPCNSLGISFPISSAQHCVGRRRWARREESLIRRRLRPCLDSGAIANMEHCV